MNTLNKPLWLIHVVIKRPTMYRMKHHIEVEVIIDFCAGLQAANECHKAAYGVSYWSSTLHSKDKMNFGFLYVSWLRQLLAGIPALGDIPRMRQWYLPGPNNKKVDYLRYYCTSQIAEDIPSRCLKTASQPSPKPDSPAAYHNYNPMCPEQASINLAKFRGNGKGT